MCCRWVFGVFVVFMVVIVVCGFLMVMVVSLSGKKIMCIVRVVDEKYFVCSILFGVWKNG